jgi:hypothetical protein
MFRDDNELKSSIHHILDQITVRDDHFSTILHRMENTKKTRSKQRSMIRVLAPVFLSLILMVSLVFPVFGNESNLLDVYQNYRIHQSVNQLDRIEDTLTGSQHHQDLKQFIINTLLEKDFQLTPVQIQQIMAQNIGNREMIAVAVLSRISNQQPDLIMEQRRQSNWAGTLRKNRIPPARMIQEMRKFIREQEQRPMQVFLVRGMVEAYSPETGLIVVDGVPFKIHLLQDTRYASPVQIGMDVDIEAVYLHDSQKVGALSIRSFDPRKAGFIPISATIIHRERHILRVKMNDSGKEEQIILAPHIMHNPANFLIKPGLQVRFIAFRDQHKGFIAIRFRPENIPSASFP